MSEEKDTKKKDVEENKLTAVLSYLWILFLIPLLTKKRSKFCQFHAKQGLVLFIIWLVGSLVFWFPLLGQVLMLTLLIVNIIAIVKAYNGEWWEIPYVYGWSKKFNI